MASGIDSIATPAVLIDLDIAERNIKKAQSQFEKLNIAFRPHIKTHKIPALAKLQREAGAKGIACQKLSEAEVFAAAGFDDILLCYNLLDPAKISRVQILAQNIDIKVVADNPLVVEKLSQGFKASSRPLAVLVECDTGLNRCGVQSPQEALQLAQLIDASPGLRFAGLMTYPPPDNHVRVQEFLSETRNLCLTNIGSCDIISSGGTPSMKSAASAPIATEYRAGTYIYNDRSLIARNACSAADCALTVLATVISRPTATRAVIDAGSKSLTSDLLGLTGYGLLVDYPDAVISGLSEEHGHIDLAACEKRPAIGERLRIIPNHACPVSNLVDNVVFHRSGNNPELVRVAARGCVT